MAKFFARTAIALNTKVKNMQHDNDNGDPTFISMFSGIEAASVAFGPLGWIALALAEIDKAASRLLSYRYPDVPNVGDMSAHDWSQYRGKVDVVCGGPPCQAFSVAGLRESLTDARGNLSLTYMKALHAINPRNAIVENVPGWLNTPDNAFGCFLAGIVGADDALPPPHGTKWPDAGMVSGPRGRAAWRILDAQHFGLAQRRKRVIVVADFGNGADPSAVLFERVSVPWNPPACREKREGVADAAKSGAGSGGDGYWREGIGPLRAREQDSHESLAVYAPEIARCVATREGSSQDYESTTMVACVTGDITHTLKAEGADASEDGTGRGTPIIAFSACDFGGDAQVDKSPTLPVGSGKKAGGGQQMAVTVALRGREGGATAELGGEVATALARAQGGGDKPHVLTPTVYSIMPQNSGKDYKARPVEVAQPVMAGGPVGGNQGCDYVLQSAVRRLTPVECERLQGFPDNYTRIPVKHYPVKKATKNRPDDMWEADPNGGWWLMQADGPRYKQLGNSWAVPKFTWLGKRIARLMPVDAIHSSTNQERALAA